MEILTLRQGHARYDEIIGGMRRDPALLDEVWRAAESRLNERPGKVWIVAVEDGRPLAWCAYEPSNEDGFEIKCTDSYERPEAWGRGLYQAVYRVRHKLIRWSRAETYIFPEPMGLHLASGWQRTGECGWSREPGVPPHRWTRLVREADARRPVKARG